MFWLDDAPISIIVEGTTVESTDVDTVPESTESKTKLDKNVKKRNQEESTTAPVLRRVGEKIQKSRPMSEGPILSQQGSWPSKVRFYF